MSSYSYLSNNDDCTRKCRARTLDDIRARQRQVLQQSRIQSKSLKILLNRKSLLKTLMPDHEQYFTYHPPDENSAWSQSSDSTYDPWANSSWNPPNSSHEEESLYQDSIRSTPSPNSSDSSLDQTITSDINDCVIPNYWLQTPAPVSRNQRKSGICLEARAKLYKGSSSRSVHGAYVDNRKTSAEFTTLKYLLNQCQGDANKINFLLSGRWLVISDALKAEDAEIAKEAVQLLTTLSAILLPKTFLHMLQNGLIYTLRDLLYKCEVGYKGVCQLLSKLAHFIPNSIPYMVELMVNSKIVDDFQRTIFTGYNEEVHQVVLLYSTIILTLMSEDQKSLQPLLLPDVLLITGVTDVTLESYSSKATLLKLITPVFLGNLIARYFESKTKDDLHTDILESLAVCLKLMVYFNFNEQEERNWVVKLLIEFKLSKFKDDYTVQRSPLDLERYKQFLSFYQQHYNALIFKYRHLITKDDENAAKRMPEFYW